jgi:hypothetical protein
MHISDNDDRACFISHVWLKWIKKDKKETINSKR